MRRRPAAEVLRVREASPDEAETSFRELDDALLQTQTRIWLGEVLHMRFDEEMAAADLLADGELLLQVARTVWKMLLKKNIDAVHLKFDMYTRASFGKSNGRYMPYPKVDAFLKICQILGLTSIDLFSPSDVVEKRDVRRVCMCIRSFSKKAQLKNLNVPDFDVVTYTIIMPNDLVRGICRNLEQSLNSPSISYRCSLSGDLRESYKQRSFSGHLAAYDSHANGKICKNMCADIKKGFSRQLSGHFVLYPESDEAESTYNECEFQSPQSNTSRPSPHFCSIAGEDSPEHSCVLDEHLTDLWSRFQLDGLYQNGSSRLSFHPQKTPSRINHLKSSASSVEDSSYIDSDSQLSTNGNGNNGLVRPKWWSSGDSFSASTACGSDIDQENAGGGKAFEDLSYQAGIDFWRFRNSDNGRCRCRFLPEESSNGLHYWLETYDGSNNYIKFSETGCKNIVLGEWNEEKKEVGDSNADVSLFQSDESWSTLHSTENYFGLKTSGSLLGLPVIVNGNSEFSNSTSASKNCTHMKLEDSNWRDTEDKLEEDFVDEDVRAAISSSTSLTAQANKAVEVASTDNVYSSYECTDNGSKGSGVNAYKAEERNSVLENFSIEQPYYAVEEQATCITSHDITRIKEACDVNATTGYSINYETVGITGIYGRSYMPPTKFGPEPIVYDATPVIDGSNSFVKDDTRESTGPILTTAKEECYHGNSNYFPSDSCSHCHEDEGIAAPYLDECGGNTIMERSRSDHQEPNQRVMGNGETHAPLRDSDDCPQKSSTHNVIETSTDCQKVKFEASSQGWSSEIVAGQGNRTDGFDKEKRGCEQELVTTHEQTEKATDPQKERKQGNGVLRSVAGGMTLAGALILFLHLRGRRRKENINRDTVPPKTQKSSHEILTREGVEIDRPDVSQASTSKPVELGRSKVLYPGEKLKF